MTRIFVASTEVQNCRATTRIARSLSSDVIVLLEPSLSRHTFVTSFRGSSRQLAKRLAWTSIRAALLLRRHTMSDGTFPVKSDCFHGGKLSSFVKALCRGHISLTPHSTNQIRWQHLPEAANFHHNRNPPSTTNLPHTRKTKPRIHRLIHQGFNPKTYCKHHSTLEHPKS